MKHASPFAFILVCILGFVASPSALGQTLRLNLANLNPKVEETSPWSTFIRYGVLTDLADDQVPRAYTNTFAFSSSYKINSNWSVGGEASLGAAFVGGQIYKGPEQTYTEVVNPNISLELDYGDKLDQDGDSYTLFAHAAPLFDQPSQLEGYRGLIGVGGGLVFSFFDKTYSMAHTLDVSNLINTYQYASDGSANPDYSVSYSFANSFHFLKNNRLSYTFGVKATRYLDGFLGYRYSNNVSLSHTWQRFTMAVAYENGGFTQDGDVSLWYIDRYRRVVRLLANYAF